jgi:hypothetical protein
MLPSLYLRVGWWLRTRTDLHRSFSLSRTSMVVHDSSTLSDPLRASEVSPSRKSHSMALCLVGWVVDFSRGSILHSPLWLFLRFSFQFSGAGPDSMPMPIDPVPASPCFSLQTSVRRAVQEMPVTGLLSFEQSLLVCYYYLLPKRAERNDRK